MAEGRQNDINNLPLAKEERIIKMATNDRKYAAKSVAHTVAHTHTDTHALENSRKKLTRRLGKVLPP